jgi:hypothetical protein
MSRPVNLPDTPSFEALEPRLLLDGWDGYEREIVNYTNQHNLAAGSAGATRVLENHDTGSVTVDIGTKRFNFFEQSFTGSCVTLSVNGVVSFDGDSLHWVNDSLTSLSAPFNVLSPLWDDWQTHDTGAVYYKLTASKLIMQWYDVEHWDSYDGSIFGRTVKFSVEIELHDNAEDQSVIEFNYADINTNDSGDEAGSATIGIRGRNLEETDQYSFNVPRPALENHTIRYTPLPTPFIDCQLEIWRAKTAVPEPSPGHVVLPGETIGTYWVSVTNQGNVPTETHQFAIDTYARSQDGTKTLVKLNTHRFTKSMAANGSNPYRVALSPKVAAGMRQGWHYMYFYLRPLGEEPTDMRVNNRLLTAVRFFVGGQQETFGEYSVERSTTLIQKATCQFDGTYLVPARIASAKKGRTYRLNIDTPRNLIYRTQQGLGYLALEFQALPAGAILKVNVRLGSNFIARDKVIREDRMLVIGEIAGSLRFRKRITIDVQVFNAGDGRNSMHIDMAAVMQSRDQINAAAAKNLLNDHPGRTWVRKILGL